MSGISLFVYGSLCEGMVHYGKISNFIVSCRQAQTKGSIYRLRSGYPAMRLEGADHIEGQLLEISGADLLLHLLDEFHGYNSQNPLSSMYVREKIFVTIGESVETAWVYVLNSEKIPANAKRIDGGKWREVLNSEPPLASQLTDKQKNYILKLGASTGREIVPVDLALYRELIKLELIVDKGRRLALSKLGSEVYRQLS